MGKKYFEYRGVENAVYAEVTTDTAEAFATGEVKDFTGVSFTGNKAGYGGAITNLLGNGLTLHGGSGRPNTGLLRNRSVR